MMTANVGNIAAASIAGVCAPLLLNANQAASVCGVSYRTWWTLHAAGKTPPPIRLGRRILWPAREIEAWIAAGCPSRDRWNPGKGAR